jgi:DMSO/TMAO reductase YedYZ molybdopterin-dependent catalytic subunit
MATLALLQTPGSKAGYDLPPTLRQRSIVIEHICVEGRTYIGGWSGVPRRVFLEHIGADLCAKYVAFKMADDYPSSIDMADGAAPLDMPGYPVRRRRLRRVRWDIRSVCAWRPNLELS